MKNDNVYRYVKKSKDGTEQKTTWYCSFTYEDVDKKKKKKKKTKRGFKRATDAEEWQKNFLKDIDRQKEEIAKQKELEENGAEPQQKCSGMTFTELKK